jgi:5-methylcytosine-specific restriction protein A
MDLIAGNIYIRREVHAAYGGSQQGGITPTKDSGKVFIWSNESGPHHGYQDGWSDDGAIYYYTGAGQHGDQDIEAPRHNGRLLRHAENGDDVLLFIGQKGPGGLWKYECKLSLIDYEFFQTKDADDKNRRAVRFILERVNIDETSAGTESTIVTPAVKPKPSFQTKPTTTERKGLVTSRVGQGYYRHEILQRFEGRCAVTGANSEELLIASHIVPWRDSNEFERLDVNNGILLSPTYDALFDKHLISFKDDGEILLSESVSEGLFDSLGVTGKETIRVFDGMKDYLQRHRENLR